MQDKITHYRDCKHNRKLSTEQQDQIGLYTLLSFCICRSSTEPKTTTQKLGDLACLAARFLHGKLAYSAMYKGAMVNPSSFYYPAPFHASNAEQTSSDAIKLSTFPAKTTYSNRTAQLRLLTAAENLISPYSFIAMTLYTMLFQRPSIIIKVLLLKYIYEF